MRLKSLKKLHLNRNKNTYIKRTSIILSVLILIIAIIYFTFAKYEGDSNEYTLINVTSLASFRIALTKQDGNN